MKLTIGEKAPDFTLPSTNGKNFNLYKDQSGKPCILYFYPKDFTYGCTIESCAFRDQFGEFTHLATDVLGISQDSVDSHISFKDKMRLPFELLSDVNGEVTSLYGAKVPFLNMTRRITYLLDKELIIRHIYESMLGFNKHVRQMLSKIKKLEK